MPNCVSIKSDQGYLEGIGFGGKVAGACDIWRFSRPQNLDPSLEPNFRLFGVKLVNLAEIMRRYTVWT